MASSAPSDSSGPDDSEPSKRRKLNGAPEKGKITESENEQDRDDENLRACLKKCRDLMIKEIGAKWDRFERDEKWQGERGEKLKELMKQAWEGTVGALEVLEVQWKPSGPCRGEGGRVWRRCT